MLSLCLCSTLSHFSPGIKVVGGFVKESCFQWVNIANEMQNSRLNSKCFHDLELKPGRCLWRFSAAHLFGLYFFPEKDKQTSLVFLSKLLLHIHAVTVTFTCGSCAVRARSPTVGHWAALQDRCTQIKRVPSPRCISSSVNVKFKFKFRFNEHAVSALIVWCCGILCCYYCTHFLSRKLFHLL